MRKATLTVFGTLSPILTFKLKMKTWLEVRNQLLAASGLHQEPMNNLKRNGRTCRQPTRGGAI